jgi:hypothetical protein
MNLCSYKVIAFWCRHSRILWRLVSPRRTGRASVDDVTGRDGCHRPRSYPSTGVSPMLTIRRSLAPKRKAIGGTTSPNCLTKKNKLVQLIYYHFYVLAYKCYTKYTIFILHSYFHLVSITSQFTTKYDMKKTK